MFYCATANRFCWKVDKAWGDGRRGSAGWESACAEKNDGDGDGGEGGGGKKHSDFTIQERRRDVAEGGGWHVKTRNQERKTDRRQQKKTLLQNKIQRNVLRFQRGVVGGEGDE